ncbi:MAG TPA: hypothetical protein VH761_17350 [Ilumatobacteraceae bacterium]|jgi:hypothetical protein
MRRLLALVVVGVLLIGGCGSDARDEAGDSLVQQLVDGGLERDIAECVVRAFFEGKTDAELERFFDRPQLTPDEATEFAALGARCTPSPTSS